MARTNAALLAGLVDDAALFPPGNATMVDAVAGFQLRKDEPGFESIGDFICPAARVDELIALRKAQGYGSMLVSLVLDPTRPGMYDAVRAGDLAAGFTVLGIEAPLAALGLAGARVLAEDLLGLRSNPSRLHLGFLEVPRDATDDALDAVRTTGWSVAKYRTGGVTADAYPSEVELAHFLVGCSERRLRFKLTAGLHHAARSTTAEGFEQHGVLNVLLGVRLALDAADRGEVALALAERNAELLAKEVRSWTRAEGKAVRGRWTSFGCCGVTEPLDELRALGVLDDIADADVDSADVDSADLHDADDESW